MDLHNLQFSYPKQTQNRCIKYNCYGTILKSRVPCFAAVLVKINLYNSPLNADSPPCSLKLNLQISPGKTNALESQLSGYSIGKGKIGLTKDHGKVMS